RSEARVPAGEAKYAQPAHGIAALFVERVEADLNRGVDGRRFERIASASGEARQLFREERQATGMFGDAIDLLLLGGLSEHRVSDAARGALRRSEEHTS